MADESLILHVKGTEQTTSLPRAIVRAGIAKGQISRSQLIWSPKENTWKQVRELPELWPSQKLAPAPNVRVPQGVSPQATNTAGNLAAKPRVQAATAAKATAVPTAAPVATASTPQVLKKPDRSHLDEPPDHTFAIIKWICIALGCLILAALAGNYFMVDEPLTARMGRTSYAKVGVWGHLGAFMQPGFIIIHVPTGKVPATELTAFMVALAHSTPDNLRGEAFEEVCLTTGLTAHYSFSGTAWKDLGDMGEKSPEEIQNFILQQLTDGSGNPLAAADPSLSSDAQEAQRARAWTAFAAYFQ